MHPKPKFIEVIISDISVKGHEKLKVLRVSSRSKPRPIEPNSWWGVDLTKVLTGEGWAYLVVVNDWFTKKILGVFVADRSRARDWLETVNQAVCRQFGADIREAENLELNLMSDNGSQPTRSTFMRECRALAIKQAFTAYANPKGNADTERLIRTLKEELCWLREWSSVEECGRRWKSLSNTLMKTISIRHLVAKRQMHLKRNG